MDSPDFFLASSEGYQLEKPRSCKRIKRVRSDTRDDLLLIKVEPPLIGQPYGLGGRDIDTLLIAARHKGYSFFPIKEWPVFVHVARLLIENPEQREQIHDNEFESIAWAELYRTKEDARAMHPRQYPRSVVLFEPQQMGEGQWEIRVQTPAGEISHITEFKSEKEAESWLASDRRRAWLKERGWERWDIDPPKSA